MYIYSEMDDMISRQDIQHHVAEARRFGFNVELEKLNGSGHVAHARAGNGERYWWIVEKLGERFSWISEPGMYLGAGPQITAEII